MPVAPDPQFHQIHFRGFRQTFIGIIIGRKIDKNKCAGLGHRHERGRTILIQPTAERRKFHLEDFDQQRGVRLQFENSEPNSETNEFAEERGAEIRFQERRRVQHVVLHPSQINKIAYRLQHVILETESEKSHLVVREIRRQKRPDHDKFQQSGPEHEPGHLHDKQQRVCRTAKVLGIQDSYGGFHQSDRRPRWREKEEDE